MSPLTLTLTLTLALPLTLTLPLTPHPSPLILTLTLTLTRCNSSRLSLGCRGITFESEEERPQAPVKVYFKAGADPTHDPHWQSYVLRTEHPGGLVDAELADTREVTLNLTLTLALTLTLTLAQPLTQP